jgi:hypothetical protein
MIENSNFYIEILRKRESYDFIVDKNHKYSRPFRHEDYVNNRKNNMIDTFILKYKNEIIFQNDKEQTVANYPLAHLRDTLAPGVFQMVCFVRQGGYANPIHGIINALDMEGQLVNENSMQFDENHWKGRWLVHDNTFEGKALNFCYSMACIMRKPDKQIELNQALRKYGIDSDNHYIINGIIKEV